ncbi:hypothetical protein C8Q80DRAFT_303302 [Daedaleopsis nitida]|nr:hypothetical protein C8Q80DRAFT_303302 [Daedaleopsis nitida]
MLQPSDGAGQPKTTYTIDGLPVGSYTAPFISETQYNITFFSKRDLEPGPHSIVVTTDFETKQALVSLDYFLVDPAESNIPPASGPDSVKAIPSSTSSTKIAVPHSSHSLPKSVSSVILVPTPISQPSASPSHASSPISEVGPWIATSQASLSPISHTAVSSLSVVSIPGALSSPSVTSLTRGDAPSMSSSGSAPTVTVLKSPSPNLSTTSPRRLNIPAVVGGALGGLSLLTLTLIGCYICTRRRPRRGGEPSWTGPLTGCNSAVHNSTPSRQMSMREWDALASSVASTAPSRSPSHRLASAQPSEYSLHPTYPGSIISESPLSPSDPSDAELPAWILTSSYPSNSKMNPSLCDFESSSAAALIPGPGSNDLPPVPPSRSTIFDPSKDHNNPSVLDTPAYSYGNGRADTPENYRSEVARSRWYAPAGWHSRAQSLLSVFSAGGRNAAAHEQSGQQHRDSGLRMYAETALPPPYTPE